MKRISIAGLLLPICFLSESFLLNALWAASTSVCGDAQSSATPPYIPTTGTFRVLIVFVQFQDDVFDSPPTCISDATNGWPSSLHAIPNWATGTKLIHSQATPPYTSGSLSDFYYVMSNGNFNFIGDVYSQLYLTPQTKSYYDYTQGRGLGWLNQQIIDWMDPNVNFANYDNDNDGDVDMILFLYRNWNKTIIGAPFQGIADLEFSGSIVRDGKTILGGFPGSGTSQNDIYTLANCRDILTHEISHYQFGSGHFDFLGEFGVHDGLDGTSAMSGYERYLLNWINPTIITSNTSITLTDAATTSNYYRINIPNSNEYFLLENRQALSVYDQSDFCQTRAIQATGLMIAHILPSAAKIDQIRWEAADNTFLQDGDPGQSHDSYKPGNKVQFTPWTRPNSDRSDGNFTGIAVTNIGQSGNNITADIVINFSSGTLTEDSWWEVSESIGGNVTLISGKTLTVTPNTTVTFSSGATVTINGSLVANSTISGQRITFTGTTATPGFWNGIKINSGSSTNMSTLRRCDVQYATTGITITYTGNTNNVTIDKCKVRNNSSFGLYVAGNGSGATVHPAISNNTIANNNNSGIYLTNYAKPTITGNRIENNGYAGIEGISNNSATVTYNYIAGNLDVGVWLTFSSSAIFDRNTVKSNYGNGVYCGSNSNVTAYGSGNGKGRNEITGNSGVGVYASSSSPNFGQDVTNQFGNNWIHDNTSYEAQQTGAGYQFSAKRCFWSGQQSNISGNVLTSPVLTSQPTPVGWGNSDTYDPTLRMWRGDDDRKDSLEILVPIAFEQSVLQKNSTISQTSVLSSNTADLQTTIEAGRKTGDWSAAIDLITELHRELQNARTPAVDFTLVNSYANDLTVAAFIRKMLALVLMEKDLVDNNTSIALAKLTAFRQGNSANAAELLANAGLIHLYRQNDLAAAQNVLAQLQTMAQSGDAIAAEHVKAFGRILQDYQSHRESSDLAKSTITPSPVPAKLPANSALAQNYPNPFNPETTIRFHLSERQKVRLLIFDLNGKRVRTLVEGELPAGAQTMLWDGRDQQGQTVASGVYFYELTAGNKIDRKR
jgi:M6 family metalloprotease-like protein